MDFSTIKDQLKNMTAFWIICGLVIIGVTLVPYVYDKYPSTRWVFDDMTNPYITIEQLNAMEPEYREKWLNNMEKGGHADRSRNYTVLGDGTIAPLTPLDEEGLKLQEKSCSNVECHTGR